MYSQLEIKKDAIVVNTGDAEFHPATVKINGLCYFRDLPSHLCSKQLLYKTEDNWFVYEQDTYPTYKVDKHLQILQFAACDTLGSDEGAKYFHSKEAANDYVLMNKPCLSVEDFIGLWKSENVRQSPLIEDVKALAILKTGSADR